MMERFNLKYFSSEEEACQFLNKLDKESRASDRYNGRHFNFKVVYINKESSLVTLLYEVWE